MAKILISDALWSMIEPLLPRERPKPRGGRPAVPHRAALSGILFVLRSGIPWEMLPQQMGCGGGGDLLAKVARLAEGRCVGSPAP